MSNLILPSNRIMNFGIFFITVLTIVVALYMEHVMLLSPCGLCITQRVFFILCGFVCLVSALHDPEATTQRLYSLIAASMCVFGSYFSIRQIWLQNLPEEEVPACGPGLTYIMDNFPFIEMLNFLLKGDVFTKDVIDMWISYKREVEVDAVRMRPCPEEFALYFDC